MNKDIKIEDLTETLDAIFDVINSESNKKYGILMLISSEIDENKNEINTTSGIGGDLNCIASGLYYICKKNKNMINILRSIIYQLDKESNEN